MVRFSYSPPKAAAKKTPSSDSPLEEFHSLVDQLEQTIAEAKHNHMQKLMVDALPKNRNSPRLRLRGFFARRSNRNDNQQLDLSDDDNPHNPLEQSTTAPSTISPASVSSSVSPVNRARTMRRERRQAEFVPLPMESVVEQLRRLAELVVTGENFTTSLQNKERAKAQRLRDRWKNRDVLDDLQDQDDDDEDLDAIRNDPKTKDYMQLFDLFFERQVLDTIISLLTGAAFQEATSTDDGLEKADLDGHLVKAKSDMDDGDVSASFADAIDSAGNGRVQQDIDSNDPKELTSEESESGGQDGLDDREEEGAGTGSEDSVEESHTVAGADDAFHGPPTREQESHPIDNDNQTRNGRVASTPLALPPIDIARQGLQSLSILIQNVSRATSLFMILSNNRINELISMPLDAYLMALSSEQGCELSPESSEFAELTTHFVTFLKSLALRMNAQTLQFFLKYPEHQVSEAVLGDDQQLSSQRMSVDFILYERALEFCAATQESFVRTTALNICLNTLRLASVAPSDDDDGDDESLSSSTKSPSGVLHDTRPLPFRERLAIAQFSCIPSRVELLVSPICTKLAEKWASLDEQIREIDASCLNRRNVSADSDALSRSNDLMERAHEVAKVERMIRVFKERAADLLDELHLLNDVLSAGLTVLNEQLIEMLFATFVYPLLLQPLRLYSQRLEKSATETTLNVLDLNPLDERLPWSADAAIDLAKVAGPAKTALVSLCFIFNTLHNMPLLKLVYTALLHHWSPDTSALPTLRRCLEVSTVDGGKQVIRLDELIIGGPHESRTYPFGRDVEPADPQGHDTHTADASEALVFVLAPALADVLELSNAENSPLTCSRPNPYRLALMSFLDVPDTAADIQNLAVAVLDGVFTAIDRNLVSATLFGSETSEPRTEECKNEPVVESSPVIESSSTSDFIIGLAKAVIFASSATQSKSDWKLGYNATAAHALLCCCRAHRSALSKACTELDQLCKRAAAFMTSYSCDESSPMGGSPIPMIGAPSINSPEYEDTMAGRVKHFIFFDMMDRDDSMPVMERLLILPDFDETGLYLPIASEGGFDFICSCVGRHAKRELLLSNESLSEREMIELAREGIEVLLKANALLNLLQMDTVDDLLTNASSSLSGFAAHANGSLRELPNDVEKMCRQVYCSVSGPVRGIIREPTAVSCPEEGSFLILDEFPYLACVCEVAGTFAGLFKSGDAGVVAEGVTWQSLFLGLLKGYLIFIHPRPDESETRRGVVVSTCRMEHLSVRVDSFPPDNGSPARRLILTHSSVDKTPPLLFLFDALPQDEFHGPFVRSKPFTSSLDVWFEDQNASDAAFELLSSQLFAAKAERGRQASELLFNVL